MKKIAIPICSIIISYLFNCYAYNSFDSSKFPLEAKILQCLGVLIIIAVTVIVRDETILDQKNTINRLRRGEL